MKQNGGKKFAVFSLLVIFGAGAFAYGSADWVNNIALGFGVPIVSETIEDSYGSSDLKGTGICFDFKAQSIHAPSGFTFEAGLGLGGINVDDFFNGKAQWGFDFNATMGFGYAFVRGRRALLTLTGTFGYDLSLFKKTISYISNYSTYDLKFTAVTMAFFAGADFMGTFRINDRIGIYASVFAGVPLLGFGTEKASLAGRSKSDSLNINAGGYYIKPSFGLAITF